MINGMSDKRESKTACVIKEGLFRVESSAPVAAFDVGAVCFLFCVPVEDRPEGRLVVERRDVEEGVV